MSICEYHKCRKKFEPNPRNRSANTQRYCSQYCKWHAWNEANPRVPINPPINAPIKKEALSAKA